MKIRRLHHNVLQLLPGDGDTSMRPPPGRAIATPDILLVTIFHLLKAYFHATTTLPSVCACRAAPAPRASQHHLHVLIYFRAGSSRHGMSLVDTPSQIRFPLRNCPGENLTS